jgi:hypothetical protein
MIAYGLDQPPDEGPVAYCRIQESIRLGAILPSLQGDAARKPTGVCHLKRNAPGEAVEIAPELNRGRQSVPSQLGVRPSSTDSAHFANREVTDDLASRGGDVYPNLRAGS